MNMHFPSRELKDNFLKDLTLVSKNRHEEQKFLSIYTLLALMLQFPPWYMGKKDPVPSTCRCTGHNHM